VFELAEIKCPDCNKEFSSREEYSAHRLHPCKMLEAVPIHAPIKPVQKSEYYSAFSKMPDGKFKCLICNRYFDKYVAIGTHLGQVHRIHMTKDEQVMYSRMKAKENYIKNKEARMNYCKTAKPSEPTIPTVDPMPKCETANPLPVIKFCLKCQTIWDGAYAIKFCPDCGYELKEPLRRKSFQVV